MASNSIQKKKEILLAIQKIEKELCTLKSLVSSQSQDLTETKPLTPGTNESYYSENSGIDF